VTRPRLLDLYCGGGGAGYPFAFVQGDALAFLEAGGAAGFAAVHASPPCQAYSSITRRWGPAVVASHPMLISPTRELLEATGLPYVIENVEPARRDMRAPIRLCGTSFGLGAGRRELRRHRLFELGGWDVLLVPPCAHGLRPETITVAGGAGGTSRRDGLTFAPTADRLEAMGTPWLTGREVVDAVPPAYTRWLGERLLEELGA
jgi:DNA (cytosine-5)-methyltransferase 1